MITFILIAFAVGGIVFLYNIKTPKNVTRVEVSNTPEREIQPEPPPQPIQAQVLPTVEFNTDINKDISFVAIDFETANKNYSSACSLGIAVVRSGKITETRHWLIRPPYNRFEFTYLHGIAWQHVENKGTFGELWNEIQPYLQDEILVAHNAYGFDMRVLEDLTQFYNIEFEVEEVWDTLEVARSTWTLPNYKLDTVCRHLNIELNHHDAESDAKAAAWIALHGIGQTKIKSKPITPIKPIKKSSQETIVKRRRVKPLPIDFDECTLDGNTIVFTGELSSMSRDEAIDAAQNVGAIVRTRVSRKTNFLVVGLQVSTIGERSMKEIKADELITEGSNIRILTEDEFLEML